MDELKKSIEDRLDHILEKEDDVRQSDLQASKLEEDINAVDFSTKERGVRVSANDSRGTLKELLEFGRLKTVVQRGHGV